MDRRDAPLPSGCALQASPDTFPHKGGRRAFLLSLAASVAAIRVPALAQAPAPSPAQYTGADRTARLIAGAKKEGFLNLYSSAITEHMNAVIAGFEKQY